MQVTALLALAAVAAALPVLLEEIALPSVATSVTATGIPSAPFLLGMEAPGGIALVLVGGDCSFGLFRLPGFGCLDLSVSSGGSLCACLAGPVRGVRIFDLTGGGVFEPALPGFLVMPEDALLSDVTGDGVEDLVLADFEAGMVAVLDLSSAAEPCVLLAQEVSMARAAVPFDPDGDGRTGLALCGCAEGIGIIDAPWDAGALRETLDPAGAKDLLAVDLDLDGDDDLVAVPCSECRLTVLENLAEDGWAVTSIPLEAVPKAVVTAMLDWDSLPDLVAATAGSPAAGVTGLSNPGRPGLPWNAVFDLPGACTALCVSDGLMATCSYGGRGEAPRLSIYRL